MMCRLGEAIYFYVELLTQAVLEMRCYCLGGRMVHSQQLNER